MRKLLIATTNKGKAKEIIRLFTGIPAQCVHLGEISADSEILAAVESGSSLEENARIKAVHYAKATGLATVAEDAGLVIPVLGGWPGVHSARVAKTDSERIALALSHLKGKSGIERIARFESVATFFDPETGEIEIFKGVVEGFILDEPKGENGFGYDPIFYFPGFKKSFAELSPEEKNMISHRGQSFRALARWLKWSGWPATDMT
ncbi:MAG TPA: RdgB/HAM1 family non-canonical purine NTP pyrophosphatase [Firmicutes bacterium]|nr:RdgB/HAM1 family non-canonical purine NTP pyrophosphatase [Bacillota bacterium]